MSEQASKHSPIIAVGMILCSIRVATISNICVICDVNNPSVLANSLSMMVVGDGDCCRYGA